MRKSMAVAAVLALGLAGCGGDSPETRAVHAINRAQDDAGAEVMSAAGGVTGASSAGSVDAAVSRQAGVLEQMARRVAAVDLPDRARRQQAALVAQIRQAAALVRGWRDDPRFAADVRAAQDRVKATTAALNRELGR